MPRFAHEALTSEVIGAFFDVYNELKYGLLESLYRAAVEIVLTERGLFVRREVPLEVRFHGLRIGLFRADMIVNDALIVEIKAGAILPVGAKPQLINYLRISTLDVACFCSSAAHPSSSALFARDRALRKADWHSLSA